MSKTKKYYSVFDNKGKLYIDCTECNRGINGNDEDKCSCGQKTKKPNCGGCFIGDLLPSIDESKLKKLL